MLREGYLSQKGGSTQVALFRNKTFPNNNDSFMDANEGRGKGGSREKKSGS
jgi:hypothetical protein